MQSDSTLAVRRKVCTARVVQHGMVSPDCWRLVLAVRGFPASAAGQFVMLGPASRRGGSGADGAGATAPSYARPFLKRPYSIAWREDIGDGDCRLCILYRLVGAGTRWLSRLEEGSEVSLVGPLGRGFDLPEGLRCALLVGGGIGIAPLVYLARVLQGRPSVRTVLFLGLASSSRSPVHLDWRAWRPTGTDIRPQQVPDTFGSADVVLATEDGSAGYHGTVVEALARWLDEQRAAAETTCVYACGPEQMLRACAEICRDLSLRCQVCLERRMACGTGVCQSCVVRVRSADEPDGWVYKLCCEDGPVFDADEVLWE